MVTRLSHPGTMELGLLVASNRGCLPWAHYDQMATSMSVATVDMPAFGMYTLLYYTTYTPDPVADCK